MHLFTRRFTAVHCQDNTAKAKEQYPEWADLPDHGSTSASAAFNDFAWQHGLPCNATDFCYGAAQAFTAVTDLLPKPPADQNTSLSAEMRTKAADLCTPRYIDTLAKVGAQTKLRSLASPDDRVVKARITDVRIVEHGWTVRSDNSPQDTTRWFARDRIVVVELRTVCQPGRSEKVAIKNKPAETTKQVFVRFVLNITPAGAARWLIDDISWTDGSSWVFVMCILACLVFFYFVFATPR